MAILRRALTAAALIMLIAPAASAEPMRVKIGLYLIHLGKVDTTTGIFTVDAYLSFKCDKAPCTPENFEVVNGSLSRRELQEGQPAYKVYRIYGEMRIPIDLRRFPFDHQELAIEIEDKMLDATQLVYVADPDTTGVDPRVNDLGWIVDRAPAVRIRDEQFPIFNEAYSEYVFAMRISRPVLPGIMKGLMPAIAIAFSGLLSLLLAPAHAMQRLTISTSALVGSVLYHLNLTSAIPHVAYFTFADRFMLVNYLTLTLCITATVVLLKLVERNHAQAAGRMHRIIGMAIPALWIGLHTVNAFL